MTTCAKEGIAFQPYPKEKKGGEKKKAAKQLIPDGSCFGRFLYEYFLYGCAFCRSVSFTKVRLSQERIIYKGTPFAGAHLMHMRAFRRSASFAYAQDLKLSLRVLHFLCGILSESQSGSSVRTALFDQRKCFVNMIGVSFHIRTDDRVKKKPAFTVDKEGTGVARRGELINQIGISVQVCRIEADNISCFQGFLPLRRPEGKHGAQGIFVTVQSFKFCEEVPHVFKVFVHERFYTFVLTYIESCVSV